MTIAAGRRSSLSPALQLISGVVPIFMANGETVESKGGARAGAENAWRCAWARCGRGLAEQSRPSVVVGVRRIGGALRKPTIGARGFLGCAIPPVSSATGELGAKPTASPSVGVV